MPFESSLSPERRARRYSLRTSERGIRNIAYTIDLGLAITRHPERWSLSNAPAHNGTAHPSKR